MQSAFFGGIRPAPKKNLSAGKMGVPPVPETVVIPLSQHAGNPAVPVVSVGEFVRLGQMIGEPSGLSAPVHSSVSGIVEAIGERMCAGGPSMCFVIRNDGFDTPEPTLEAFPSKVRLLSSVLRNLVREAGIVCLDRTGYPMYAKLDAAAGKADVLIADACECEPYITADDVLLRNYAKEVLTGLDLMADALGVDRCVVALGANKEEARKSVQEALSAHPGIELEIIPAVYPAGAENQLIRAVTGREAPPYATPADTGCLVFNVSTVYAVWQAVYAGTPSIERIVSVTGEGIRRPRNLKVRIGTSFEEVISSCGGLKENVSKVIAGGPMTGLAVPDLSVPVTKTTNAIVCLTESQAASDSPVCIRCGRCTEVCPEKLEPLYLYRFAKASDRDMLSKLHLADCLACGTCDYVCPGKLPLSETFRNAKTRMREEKR